MIIWEERKEVEEIEGECPHFTRLKRSKKSECCKNCKRIETNECQPFFKTTDIAKGYIIRCSGSEF